jgi:hypothetical protein
MALGGLDALRERQSRPDADRVRMAIVPGTGCTSPVARRFELARSSCDSLHMRMKRGSSCALWAT